MQADMETWNEADSPNDFVGGWNHSFYIVMGTESCAHCVRKSLV